ncbi:hypothetical protein MAPG_10415 [Magnaporthiopsis poae ATCC 64411]|uniref:Uncharacterized protein n=1 Tax=Magnaporthiopsis poae (strain ATCC 64411 / 73-15) TaxID=644358 RepID=A0A0C4ECI8_MAGP6|nr:hypothetical protein MAPG_10415 [Magnaporthiopsis poae ATCC 64411]
MSPPSSSSTSTPAESPRAASGSSSQKQKRNKRNLPMANPPKSRYFKVWYCCQCRDGPLNASVVSICPNSNCGGHYRCNCCTVQTLEKHD